MPDATQAESGGGGFIGPLTEVDQDRCPLCGLDPTDPTLHGPTCPTVTLNLCGVIQVERMCMRPEHMPQPVPSGWDAEWWGRWTGGHEWVPLTRVFPPASTDPSDPA